MPEGENKKGSQQQKPRSVFPVLMIMLTVMFLVVYLTGQWAQESKPWSRLITNIQNGHVTKIVIGTNSIQVEAIAGEKPEDYTVLYPGGRLTDALREELNSAIALSKQEHQQDVVEGGDQESTGMYFLLSVILPIVLIFAIFWFFFRRMNQGGGVLSFGKSRATLVGKGKSGKTFKDVAGIDEAKEEVEELVEFLRNPEKFQSLGGRIPKGVLLIGPPGTGKTLLAKAIAGEADVPFYTISGSDFVEMFVGVGASRVRDLFSQAKESSPCIIFIDEIDAVARKRSQGGGPGGHDEREQTLNAILVEMDGFDSNEKVIVMAATNRVDVLDPALLRPGRFDRHIYVDAPDIKGREQILEVHAQRIKLVDGVDLSIIARGTPGFSGADLENLVNEAALHAARGNKKVVDMLDLEYARDRVAFGREKVGRSNAMPYEEKRATAYHEAGHAIIQYLLEECDDLHKVTIIPRGRALGMTMGLPKEKYSKMTKDLLGDICLLFGGRVAEEVFCDDVSTGASNDIERATDLARGMVYEWGMSEKMGPVKYTDSQASWGGAEKVVAASEETRRELDKEVRRILDEQYARAQQIIADNRDGLESIAMALLEWETLHVEQIKTLLDGGDIGSRPSGITGTFKKPDMKQEEKKEESAEVARDGDADSDPSLNPSLA